MGLLGAMSAVGTALGPSLGGLLIAGVGWRAIPRQCPRSVSWRSVLARRICPPLAATRRPIEADSMRSGRAAGRDARGLCAGDDARPRRLRSLNTALLLAVVGGSRAVLFAETRVRSPLIRLAMLRVTWR